MDKREKVIKALEFCLMPTTEEELMSDVCSHADCPYFREYKGGKCIEAACKDALALLEAQEPVEPVYELGITRCGQCNHEIDKYGGDNYCPQCGRAVKWE